MPLPVPVLLLSEKVFFFWKFGVLYLLNPGSYMVALWGESALGYPLTTLQIWTRYGQNLQKHYFGNSHRGRWVSRIIHFRFSVNGSGEFTISAYLRCWEHSKIGLMLIITLLALFWTIFGKLLLVNRRSYPLPEIPAHALLFLHALSDLNTYLHRFSVDSDH